MSADLPTPIRPAIEVRHGAETPKAQRDSAYEVWLWSCGRNTRETARELGIGESTIRNWSRMDGWSERAARDLMTTPPQYLRESIGITLVQTAEECSKYMYRVASGAVMPPDRERLKMCTSVLQMVGWSPARFDPERDKPRDAPRAYSIDLDTATPEQLLQLEAEIIERGG